MTPDDTRREAVEALFTALYGDRCVSPPPTEHAEHVLAALTAAGWTLTREAPDVRAALGEALKHIDSATPLPPIHVRARWEAALAAAPRQGSGEGLRRPDTEALALWLHERFCENEVCEGGPPIGPWGKRAWWDHAVALLSWLDAPLEGDRDFDATAPDYRRLALRPEPASEEER